MTGVFYSRDARLSISSSPMIVWVRNLFSCILQATSSKPLWYQAIFIVGIIHSQLPSSKFNMPILCAQSLRLPSSKLRCHYFALNHCGCRPPSLKGRIRETDSPKQKAIWEDEIFEKQWLLTATRAEKSGKYSNRKGVSGAPKARLFLFFERARSGRQMFQGQVVCRSGLLYTATAAGKQSLGSSFYPPGLNWGPAPSPGSL